ncbi:MAG TPA: hypothetical protein VJN95_15645 [Gemmatimonadales bacterium]|nr:hypothetical protein [Gemmatimonadales bacterium]
MRLMIALAAAIVTLSDDCGGSSDLIARSVHPWVAPESPGCTSDLSGAWNRASDSTLWVLIRDERESPESSDCTYAIFVTDTDFARALLTEPSASALFHFDDSSARREVAMNPVAARRWDRDSSKMSALTSGPGYPNLAAGIVGRIGGEQFLDLEGFEGGPDVPLGFRLQTPIHLVWQFQLAGDSLIMRPLAHPDAMTLSDTVEPKPHHETEEYRMLFTSSTRELYYSILHHARDPRVFDPHQAEVFTRWKLSPPGPDAAPGR